MSITGRTVTISANGTLDVAGSNISADEEVAALSANVVKVVEIW